MKVIVCTEYGSPDVLQLKEVEKPIPEDDEVLVEVHCVSVKQKQGHLFAEKRAIGVNSSEP